MSRSAAAAVVLSPRRRGSLAVAAALLLTAACSADASDEPDAGGSSSDAFPVTVDHKFGTTVVKGSRRRVVTVGVTEQDKVLALG